MTEQLKMKFKCFEFRMAESKCGWSAKLCYDCFDNSGDWVGVIGYDKSWGQWAFAPDEGTLLDRDRLQDIANFLEQLTMEQG